MKPVIYRSNKTKILLVLIAMIVLTGIGALLCWFVPKLLNWAGMLPIVLTILCYAVTAIGIIGIIAGILRLLSTKFDLTLTPEGIKNNSEFGKAGFIPWSAIDRIELNKIGINSNICIFLKDPEAFSKQLTGLKQMAVELMVTKYGTPCVITVSALKADPNEIEQRMNEFISKTKP